MGFVTTRAEYEWNDETGRYELIAREGYEYDGPWTLGLGGNDVPPPPDPAREIEASASVNRINQITPYGRVTYSGPNNTTATLTLDPRVQALADSQIESDTQMLAQALQRQQELPQSPIDLSAFGPIQSGIDTSNINFAPPSAGSLPGLDAPTLQTSVPTTPIQSNVDLSLNTSGLPGIPQDPNQFRADVERAVFERGRGLLDPFFSDQQRALEQRLANQGLPTSGEAYDRDISRFLREQNRAYGDLANQAVITGGSEASRALGDILASRGQGFGEAVTGANLNLAGGQFANQAAGQAFGQGLQAAAFGNQAGLLGLGADQGIRSQLFGEELAQNQAANQASAQNLALQQQLLQNQNAARAQALSEAQNLRGTQFNELAALLGLQQVQQPQLQNFFAPGAVDVGGAYGRQFAGQQANYAQQQQQDQALMSGLFGLGGAFLGGPAGGALLGNVAPKVFGG